MTTHYNLGGLKLELSLYLGNDFHPSTGIPVKMLQLGYMYLKVSSLPGLIRLTTMAWCGIDHHRLADMVFGTTCSTIVLELELATAIMRHALLSMRMLIQNGVLHELSNRNRLKMTRYDMLDCDITDVALH